MAIDYEFRILVIEKELAHLKEMQNLIRLHQDAHDQSLGAVENILERIESNVEKLSAAQLITEQRLQNLIDVLAREHSNGKR